MFNLFGWFYPLFFCALIIKNIWITIRDFKPFNLFFTSVEKFLVYNEEIEPTGYNRVKNTPEPINLFLKAVIFQKKIKKFI